MFPEYWLKVRRALPAQVAGEVSTLCLCLTKEKRHGVPTRRTAAQQERKELVFVFVSIVF
jgi:hypothetical protein